MLELQKRIEKETAAEAMIEAKGFKEAMCVLMMKQ